MAGMLWDGKFLEIGSRRALFERKQNPLALTAGRKAQKATDISRLYITPDKILTWLDQGLKRWRWFMSGTKATLAHICLNTCPFFEDHTVSFEDILGHHHTYLEFFACGCGSQYHQETSHGLTSKKIIHRLFFQPLSVSLPVFVVHTVEHPKVEAMHVLIEAQYHKGHRDEALDQALEFKAHNFFSAFWQFLGTISLLNSWSFIPIAFWQLRGDFWTTKRYKSLGACLVDSCHLGI